MNSDFTFLNQPETLTAQRRFICPQCGGNLRFNPAIQDLQCSYCGHIQEIEEEAVQPAEQILQRALFSPEGYSRASVERMLCCQQCGAVTIFPPAQTSLSCPYCDSAVFAVAAEDLRLKTPQALTPMKMEASDVEERVVQWLKHGFFYPPDLAESLLCKLSPLYVPIWLLSAVISFPDPAGPSSLGKRDLLYFNWVVPGIRQPAARYIPALKPFDWNDLVEFKPEYLARWPASTYQVSISSASQQACMEIRKDARRKLPLNVSSEGLFSCQSYKLVLFPVWMCNYIYHGKRYCLVVNGQTGVVAGDKPLDWPRVVLTTVAALMLLTFLIVMLGRIVLPAWQEAASLFLGVSEIFGEAWLLLLPAVLMLLILVIVILKS